MKSDEPLDITAIIAKAVKQTAQELAPSISNAAQQAADAAAEKVARRVEGRFVAVEGKVTDQGGRIEALEEDYKTLKAAQQAMQSRLGTNLSNQSPSQAPSNNKAIARIGNLGWNDNGQTILQRAREVLIEADIPPGDYSNLAAVGAKKGSAAELMFGNPDVLEQAELAVRALIQTYAEGKWLWLDYKKTEPQLRPGRLVNRAYDILSDIESARAESEVVEKFMNGKFIKVGGSRAGYSLQGTWKLTNKAITRYTQEDLSMAKAYAEEA